LAIFRNRIVSKQDLYLAYIACSLPLFLWTFYKLFNQVPAWLVKLSIDEIIGASAYAFTYTLVESLWLWVVFLLVGALLPERAFRNKFVSYTFLISLFSSILAIIAQINYDVVFEWNFIEMLPWWGLYLAGVLLVYFVVRRFDRFSKILYQVVRSVSVLATLYVMIGVISFIIVVVRNI
jgi:hypothetical protein